MNRTDLHGAQRLDASFGFDVLCDQSIDRELLQFLGIERGRKQRRRHEKNCKT